MSAKPGCPHCQGSGYVVDPDPLTPVRICPCTIQGGPPADSLGIPTRYRQATLESFWEWWKMRHPREDIVIALQEARELLEDPGKRETVPQELGSKLEHILHKCGNRAQPPGYVGWKDLRPAQEPDGYASMLQWARKGRDRIDLWWIDGAPGTGRSTLGAGLLKAWCEHHGEAGLFVSLRTFSQELKDLYYDTRSFNRDEFRSERERVAPLLAAPCLVLDDFDRMDTDLRVIRALAQLLDGRYASERPTILTATRWVEVLAKGTPDAFPLLRLEDESLLRRLTQARRVQLKPTLARLMESVHG